MPNKFYKLFCQSLVVSLKVFISIFISDNVNALNVCHTDLLNVCIIIISSEDGFTYNIRVNDILLLLHYVFCEQQKKNTDNKNLLTFNHQYVAFIWDMGNFFFVLQCCKECNSCVTAICSDFLHKIVKLGNLFLKWLVVNKWYYILRIMYVVRR